MNGTPYLNVVERVFSALTICERNRLWWHNVDVHADASQADQLADLRSVAASIIYSNAYARPFSSAYTPLPVAPTDRDESFLRKLESSLTTQHRTDPGWTVHQIEFNGRCHVSKLGRYAVVGLDECATDVPPTPGETIALRVTRSSQTAQHHFYFAFGEQPAGVHEKTGAIRFFLHAQPHFVPALLSEISKSLNFFQIPFLFKCLDHPQNYYRSDCCVLFVASCHYPLVARLIQRVAEQNSGQFQSAIPLFTKPFAHGVAVAEDPCTGESFGQSRCILFAEAFIQWQNAGRPPNPLPYLERAFSAARYDLSRPHLNEGSLDYFEIPVQVEVGS